MDPGALLRSARRRSGLTQAALAAAAGVDRTSLVAWESGRRSPSCAVLDRLLAACGLQVRTSLEPLQTGLGLRVAALRDGPDESAVERLDAALEELEDCAAPWALDGAAAVVAHGLGAELDAVEVVAVDGPELRDWLMRSRVLAIDDAGFASRPSWREPAAAHHFADVLATALVQLRLRPVAALPPTFVGDVGGRRVRAVTLPDVAAHHPALAEVLTALLAATT